MGSRDPVIVGVGWSEYPVAPELDALEHHALASRRALDDSGLEKSAIDGYMTAGTGFASRRCGQHGRVPGDPPPLDRRHDGRWLDLRVLRPARRLGDRGRDVRCRAGHLRFGPALEDGPHARHEHVLGRVVPGGGPRASSRPGATCWPAATPWRPVATCTSSGRRLNSWRRSPSASASTPASTRRRSTATRSPSRTCSPHA